MDIETDLLFEKQPQAFSLYKMFAEKVLSEYPDAQIKIQKSQITFSNKHQLAFVWLPIRKMKTRPDNYIIVSFGLSYRLDSPRIVEAAEPYPNRWIHHLIIQNRSEVDTELMKWIKEAYNFAEKK